MTTAAAPKTNIWAVRAYAAAVAAGAVGLVLGAFHGPYWWGAWLVPAARWLDGLI